MFKIYTRKGDQGQSVIFTSQGTLKLSKNNLIFQVLGTLDSLNVHIGELLVSMFLIENDDLFVDTIEFLKRTQSIIIQVSSFLSNTDLDISEGLEEEVLSLEQFIDIFESKSKMLRTFILPGRNQKEINAHKCRCITRESERLFWDLNFNDTRIVIGKYLNRLSDYFFNLSRYFGDGPEYTKILTVVKNG